MKNLFNNPYFVSAISLAAIVYVYFTATGKSFFEENSDADSYEHAPTIDPVDDLIGLDENDAITQVIATSKVDETNINWNIKPKRNPFTPVDNDTIETVEQPVQLAEVSDTIIELTLPELSAIIINNSQRLAMINNKVLSIGDNVDAFKISKIGSNYVDLISPSGVKRISIGN